MVRVVEVEIDGRVLLMETAVVQVAGSEPTGAAERATDWMLRSFDRVQEAVERVAVSTAGMITRMSRRSARPDVVQVELGLKVSAKGDVIIAGAAGEASFKVTLTYNREVEPAR
jgi:hypothetical protein